MSASDEKGNPSRNAAGGWSHGGKGIWSGRDRVRGGERESGGRGGRQPGDDCPRAEKLE